MTCRALLFLSILIAAGCKSGAPAPKNQNFQTIVAPPGAFKARKLNGKLILQFEDQSHVLVNSGSSAPATGAEWARAANITRDEGPEPSFRDQRSPRPPFPVDRIYPTRGSQWLKVLYSTDGAYLAIVSYATKDPQPAPRTIAVGSVEQIGDLFAEIYRRPDGVRMAELTVPVYRRGTRESAGNFGFNRMPYKEDLVEEWADAVAWYAADTLIVPTHNALHIAALSPGTPTPVPDAGSVGKTGLSLASGDAPTMKVHGMREEIFRQGGLIEWVIVHLTVEPEVAGVYQVTTQFEGHEPVVESHFLRFGRQDLPFGFDKTAFGPGDHRLRWSSITSRLSTRHSYYGPPASTTSAPALVTAAYPPNVWTTGRPRQFRLLPDGATVRRTDAGFEFDMTVLSLVRGEVGLSGLLKGSLSMIGYVDGGGQLKPGSNRITFHTQNMKLAWLWGAPHSIANTSVRYDNKEVDLPESVPIPALDFRGIPGAKCAYDYNGDGRVDNGDLPAAMVSTDQEFAVMARTLGSRPPPIENVRRLVDEMIAKNRSCRTK